MLNDKQWEYLRNLFAGDSVVLDLNGVRLNRYDFDKIYTELQRLAWRPIEEAPRDGMRILLASFIGVWCQGVGQWAFAEPALNAVDGWFWPYAKRPTQWMPLPPTPKDD